MVNSGYMHSKKFFFLHLLVVFLILNKQPLQAQKVSFTHITVDDGLKSNNVKAIIQDFQGFIWIGTEDGLHRYDGNEIHTYVNSRNDTTSLGDNHIGTLYEDSFQRLWIGTQDGGLSLYNRELDQFYNFTPNPSDPHSLFGKTVSFLCETSDKVLWIASEQGGFSSIQLTDFDSLKPVFDQVILPLSILKGGNEWVRAINDAGDKKLWVVVHGAGLLLYDISKGTFSDPLSSPAYSEFKVDKRMSFSYRDDRNRIWLGTWESGLYIYYPNEHRIINIRANGGQGDLPGNQVVSFLKDAFGNFWVGTDDGLCRMLDFEEYVPKGKFEVYSNDPINGLTIATNSVIPIFEDKGGRLWVGTYFGGVNIYDPDYLRFSTINSASNKDGSLPGNNITAFLQHKEGDIWIGMDGKGLCSIDGGIENLKKGTQLLRLKNSVTGNEELKIKALFSDSKGNIWIGTWGGGMFCYYRKTKEIRHFLKQLPQNSVSSIAEDAQGMIWAGTFDEGLVLYNPENEKFNYYSHNPTDSLSVGANRINVVFADRDGQIWVGTDLGGLNKYNAHADNFSRIDQGKLHSHQIVNALFQSSEGNIWVGTKSDGIIKYQQDNGEEFQYSLENGLADNNVQGITEDKTGNLWVTTNNGLSKLTPSTNTITNFSVKEGLQSQQFNPMAAITDDAGNIIIGGVKGMNVFDPQLILKSRNIPRTVFTRLFVNNEEIKINQKSGPLKQNISLTQEIDLRHNQNSFSLEYTAVDYDYSQRATYITKLEGFEPEWQHQGNQRRVTFTNLNPAEYRFMVKPINRDGFEGDEALTMIIRIHPAWYQTRMFWISMIIFTIVVTGLFVQWRINFFKRRSRFLELKVKERTIELNTRKNEVLAQNEELSAQNDHILEQREELEAARVKLEEVNVNLETLVNERTEKLEKTIAELDRFVYSASHDLSAPLKSILGLLNIARLDSDKTHTIEYLAYIEESIMKLEDVIRSLISYSRNSRLALEMDAVFLHELVEEVFNELQFLDGAKRIATSVNIPRGVQIVSDRNRLKIVFHNLLNNAIKYADLEKPSPKIVVSLIDDGDYWIIEINDNGIGIGKEFLDKVFGMFYRATERSKGSGLGLYIVHESVSVLGGKIFLDSELGKETTFTVYLPK